ncbi:unnamed protein product [Chironomus riparius]|uniref:Uncharacterized protein n=1 Tax=Chironomus riparius TaxID=315576 RepID=A0A9N9S8S5_9DIPT|nr:unnamed protein product [Chironomus riparius]
MSKIALSLIIFTVLTTTASSAVSSKSKEYLKLKDVLNKAKETLQSIPEANQLSKYIKKINFDCIEEKLNLINNGEKSVTVYEGQLVILSSYLKCIDEDQPKLLNLIINSMGLDKNDDIVDCAKLKLHKIDPKSRFIDNFDIKSVNASYAEYCEIFTSDKGFDESVTNLEELFGPLEEFTCGAVSKLDVIKFIVNIHVLPFEIRENVRVVMTTEMIETFKMKMISTADCIIGKTR